MDTPLEADDIVWRLVTCDALKEPTPIKIQPQRYPQSETTCGWEREKKWTLKLVALRHVFLLRWKFYKKVYDINSSTTIHSTKIPDKTKKDHSNLKVGQRIELEPKLWSRDSFSHKYDIYFDKSCQMLITWLQAVRSKANKWITFQLKTVKPLFSKTQLAQLHPRDFPWIQWT